MGADSYFTIGASHAAAGEPCQDYALHGAGFGVIADGCSSSLGRPDLGARLAAISLARCLAQPDPAPEAPHRALLAGLSAVLAAGVADREDLLTTVGGFHVGANGLQAWLWGDGVLFAEFTDGSTELRVVEWQDNTPMYPIYLLDPVPPQLAATINGVAVAPVVPLHWDLRGRPLRHFLLATDGLCQIAGVPVDEAIARFLSFKTVSGAFLKRRALRALKAMTPVDDLAMVVWHEALR